MSGTVDYTNSQQSHLPREGRGAENHYLSKPGLDSSVIASSKTTPTRTFPPMHFVMILQTMSDLCPRRLHLGCWLLYLSLFRLLLTFLCIIRLYQMSFLNVW